jgi:negative regulator of flagellin synthesis FlgM
MKIYGNKSPDGQEINRSSQKISQTSAQGRIGKSETTKSVDKVEISGEGKKVAELMSAIEQLPAVREGKIKAIKEALKSGTYHVDSSKIAQKILDEL